MFINTYYFLMNYITALALSSRLSVAAEDLSEFVFTPLFFLSLWTLIIISLIGTFSLRLSIIHKVFSLLFLSIFTVFLWLMITQFLFVYLVYILAFVGAVLILFLSVVLMLPISIISSVEHKKLNVSFVLFTGSKIKYSVLNIDNEVTGPVWVYFANINWFLIMISIVFFYYLFQHVWKLLTNRFYVDAFVKWKLHYIRPLATDMVEYFLSPLGLKSLKTNQRSSKMNFHIPPFLVWPTKPFPFKYIWYWQPTNKLFIKIYSTIFSDHRKTDPKNGFFGDPFYKKPTMRVLIDTHLVLYQNIVSFFCFCYLLAELAANRFYVELINVKITHWRTFFTNQYFEVATQLFMMFSFILLVIPTSLTLVFSSFTNAVTNESIGGLANLKELLYTQTGLFILITAIVLLVALIGAAVIVRNKNK